MLAARIALTVVLVASLLGIGLVRVADEDTAPTAVAPGQGEQDLVRALR